MHPETAAELGTGCFRAGLAGYRRGWTVATDNAVEEREVAYFDPRTGARPPVQVLFLNAEPAIGARIDGIVLRIRPEDLPVLDRREGNYRRVDVTRWVDLAAAEPGRRPDRIWLYTGTREATLAAAAGTTAGTAVIWRRYLERVRAALGRYDGMLGRFDAERLPIPAGRVIDLERRRAGRPADPYGRG